MTGMANHRATVHRWRWPLVIVLVLAVVGVAISCVRSGNDDLDAGEVGQRFVDALSNQQFEDAAEYTSYPAAAQGVFEATYRDLHPQHASFAMVQFVDLGAGGAFFTMNSAWDFGADRSWQYQTQVTLRKLSVGWRITWEHTVLAPQLTDDATLRYATTYATPAPVVLDARGAVLAEEQVINSIKLDPSAMPDRDASVNRLAAQLAVVAPLVTADVLRQRLDEHPGEQILAVQLRDSDYQYLGPERFTSIPGVVVVQEPQLVTADRRVSTPLLDPLRNVWQDERTRTSGWAVQRVSASGVEHVTGTQGPPGPNIAATLDIQTQLSATEAVVQAGSPAVIVAMRPSDGAVLAVAQNTYATEQGSPAFTGLRDAGDGLDWLRNTGSGEFRSKAQQFGLDADLSVAHLDQRTASFDGAAQWTPLGAAVAAASIAAGHPVAPKFVMDQPGAFGANPAAPDAAQLDAIRNQLRANVHGGSAQALDGYPDLSGWTGKHDDDRWFIGIRGDFVFAVYVGDADAGDRALRLADRFLQEIATQR